MILNILLIAIITVIIIDLSGFIQSLESGLSKWLKANCHIPRPWSCSFCMCHHLSLIYIILTGHFSLAAWALIFLISYMTPIIKDILIFIKDISSQIITILYQLPPFKVGGLHPNKTQRG